MPPRGARALCLYRRHETSTALEDFLTTFPLVIPAQAGIHVEFAVSKAQWIPTLAGMTKGEAAGEPRLAIECEATIFDALTAKMLA